MSDPLAAAFVAGVMLVAALVTWLAARAMGAWAMHRVLLRHLLAILAAPTITLAFGIVMFEIDSARHPRADLPSMALAGVLALAAMMPLVTIPVAIATLYRARVGGGGSI